MQKFFYMAKRPPGTMRDAFNAAIHQAGERLAALGLAGVRLNMHDDDVAVGSASEFTSPAGPYEAAVQLWIDEPDVPARRNEAEAILATTGATFHGYAVRERLLRWDFRDVPGPRHRSHGYSQLAMLYKPARMDTTEWLYRWQEQHTWIALSIHPHLEYTQNLVIEAVTPEAPPLDGYGEEIFPLDCLTDDRKLFSGEFDEATYQRLRDIMFADAHYFLDFERLDMIVTSHFDLVRPVRWTPPHQ